MTKHLKRLLGSFLLAVLTHSVWAAQGHSISLAGQWRFQLDRADVGVREDVDTTGVIESIRSRKSSWMFWIRVPKRFTKLLIPVGSVAVDGVSLTVAQLRGNLMGISIIPHTWEVTTFKEYAVGRKVNIEFDMLGKYVLQLVRAYRRT